MLDFNGFEVNFCQGALKYFVEISIIHRRDYLPNNNLSGLKCDDLIISKVNDVFL